MYVYECKICGLTKTLTYENNINKCICCGNKIEEPKNISEKNVFDFENIVYCREKTIQILV